MLAAKGKSSLWVAVYMPSGYQDWTSHPQQDLRLFVFFRHSPSTQETDKCITLAHAVYNPYTDGALDPELLAAVVGELVKEGQASYEVMRAEVAALAWPDVTEMRGR